MTKITKENGDTVKVFTRNLASRVDEIYNDIKCLPDEFWNKQTINDNRYESQSCLSNLNEVSRMINEAVRGHND